MSICPVCRHENETGSFFCYKCGKYMIEALEASGSTGCLQNAQQAENQAPVNAVIALPGGREIKLNGSPLFIERSDFDNTLPQDILMCISRQHLLINYESGIYYLQDYGRDGKGSTNHSWLNGADIFGKGRQPLKDGDIIKLSNQPELTITFKLKQE